MKSQLSFFKTATLLFLMTQLWVISGCNIDTQVTIDEQKLAALEAQLQLIYTECEDENISSQEDLEEALNNGGNGLSKGCRTAIGTLNFQDATDILSLSISFELPEPEADVNPVRERTTWIPVSGWDAQNTRISFSSGIENFDAGTVSVVGVLPSGALETIEDFSFSEIQVDDAAVGYTTDYSGSMLEQDLVSLSSYQTNFHAILPNGIPTMVQLFSNDATPRFEGFRTDEAGILSALAYDPDYRRRNTALFDAWYMAIESLQAQNKKAAINILATDGFENSSELYDEAALSSLIAGSDVFNLIVASGWSEKQRLQNIVGDKGIVIYKYQIDEAIEVANDINSLLDNIRILDLTEDLSSYSELRVIVNEVDKLVIPF